MRFFKTPGLFKSILSNYIWDYPTETKTIYLTFDDGPIPRVTEYVLDILEEYQAKATFFCVGDNIRKYPQIFKSIITKYHSVGNHTFNHLDGWRTQRQDYLENIRLCREIISDTFKQNSYQEYSPNYAFTKQLFRPPYGKIKQTHYKYLKKHYEVIMWDVLTYDFDAKLSKEVCFQKAVQYTKSGSVVVFHDSLKSEEKLHYVLPLYLDHFSEQGFRFERL